MMLPLALERHMFKQAYSFTKKKKNANSVVHRTELNRNDSFQDSL